MEQQGYVLVFPSTLLNLHATRLTQIIQYHQDNHTAPANTPIEKRTPPVELNRLPALAVFEVVDEGATVTVASFGFEVVTLCPPPPPFKVMVELDTALEDLLVLVDDLLVVIAFAVADPEVTVPSKLVVEVAEVAAPVFVPVGPPVTVALYEDCCWRMVAGTGATVKLKLEHILVFVAPLLMSLIPNSISHQWHLQFISI